MDIAALRDVLTPAQLAFASRYIGKYTEIAKRNYTAYQCWLDVNPDYDPTEYRHHARVKTAEYLRAGGRTKEYIDAVLDSTGERSTKHERSIEETRRDLEAMASADITEIVAWDTKTLEDGSIIHVPKIMELESLDPAVRRLIKSVTFTKNGPKLELHDQLRAQDMLNKMRGSYAAEKLEVTGAGGGAIKVEVSGEIKLTIQKLLDDM